MAVNTEPGFPAAIVSGILKFTDVYAGSDEMLITAGTNGTRVDSINVASDDNSQDITLVAKIVKSEVSITIAVITIPMSTGCTPTIPPINLLNSISYPSAINGSMMLAPGEVLNIFVAPTPTSGANVYVRAEGGNY